MTTQPDDNKPTIVFVHGAWADAAGFGGEIRALQERGFRTIGFANPLRGLPSDANYLADLLRSLTRPVVLVGHSYGGAVISAAATGNEQVRALVYFNGWMPDEGENIQQLLENVEGSLVGPSIRPVALPARTGATARTSTSIPRPSTRRSQPTSTGPRRTSWPRPSGRGAGRRSAHRQARRPGR